MCYCAKACALKTIIKSKNKKIFGKLLSQSHNDCLTKKSIKSRILICTVEFSDPDQGQNKCLSWLSTWVNYGKKLSLHDNQKHKFDLKKKIVLSRALNSKFFLIQKKLCTCSG